MHCDRYDNLLYIFRTDYMNYSFTQTKKA